MQAVALLALLLATSTTGRPPATHETNAARVEPLRVFLRGGPKTHGPNEHDHPRFVDEWKPLLVERGAVADGALRFPTADELARTDVLVLYAAEGASIHGDERAHLETFLGRGGGLVVLHDAVCGDDPTWFAGVAGGAWQHGKAKYQTGTIDLYVADAKHPITSGAENFRFDDEIYWQLDMDAGAHVLMNGFHTPFDVTPQMWTFEKDRYRAFVSIQGHFHDSFEHPAWRTLLLRGIAWAGKRDVDSLLKPGEAEALRYPRGGPLRPADEAKALEVHPSFDVSLVAAEPLVEKPISIDWDASGRAWVAMTKGYPEKERFSRVAAHDEIAVLEDADGDGVVDAKRTYCGGLDLVTSLVFHRDGVIVSAAPDIVWLRDKDHDGTCETREVLYTGFGFADTHAVISNLRWGADGWIYGTQGYSGNDSRFVKNAANRQFGHIGNGVFRFRPDGNAIEMVASYGSNTWGLDFTSDGELLFSMANGAHLRHVVVPERVLAGGRVGNVATWTDLPDHDRVEPLLVHHDAPYAQIDFVGGFTAASGCCVYDGGAWPSEWNGAAFVAEPTVHLVHHDVVTPRGVTYGATKERAPEFLAGRDLWFRPVHMRVGPDGALYVLDFYNQAVVHNDTRGPPHGPTNFAIRPDRDHEHGRIWRVQHRDAKRFEPVDLARARNAELVAALAHPNGWVRDTALRLLTERGALDARGDLERTAREGATPEARVAAGWCLQRLAAVENVLPAMLADRDGSVRKNGARIAALRLALTTAPPDRARLVESVVELASDGDAKARLAALEALDGVRLAPDWSWRLLLAWPELDDDWSRTALVRAARASAPGVLAALFDPQYARISGPMRSAKGFDAFARELARAIARSNDGPACVELVRLAGAAPAEEEPVVEAALRALADELRPEVPMQIDAKAAQSVTALLASPSPELARAILPLAQRWNASTAPRGGGGLFATGIADVATKLAATVRDATATSEARVAALSTLLDAKLEEDAACAGARTLLGRDSPPATQKAVVEALGKRDVACAAATLVAAWPDLANDARDAAFDRLVQRARSTRELLDAIAAKTIALAELGPQRTHRLRTHPDPAIAKAAAELLERLGAKPSAKVEDLVRTMLPIASQPGDAAKGKLVFAKNCAQCHTVSGEGGKIGPDLTGMGTHGAKDLLPIVLDPNRAVEAGYAEWQLSTKDERLVTGVLVREDERSVVLRSTQGDVEVVRADVDWMKNTGRSPMPEGLESVGAEGFRDLFAYLAGGYAGWRVLDLEPVASSSSMRGLYDAKREGRPMTFARYGIVDVDGIPFEVLDPRRTSSGMNVLVLKGGAVADWESKTSKPKRVEVQVGSAVERVHVLGGVGAWAYPYFKDVRPICTWTWEYADGTEEAIELKSGVEFADWIARNDVPGSEFVDGVLAEDSWGQVRRFALEPKDKTKVVRAIAIESPDGQQAATFVALTAELAGAQRVAKAKVEADTTPCDWLIVGGGSSHDFRRWFGDADRATLAKAGVERTRYTEDPSSIAPAMEKLHVLELVNNQPLPSDARKAIEAFVERGGGLAIVHPACWYNWDDWPEYNRVLVGGGSRGHGPFGAFDVVVVDAEHPVAKDLPATFRIEDELYRFEVDPKGSPIHVIAEGRSLDGKERFPVAWTVERARGKTVCITLGHDGRAHDNASYRTLLANASRWLLAR